MKRVIPIFVLIGVILGGYWWFSQPSEAAGPASGPVGSGAIEAEHVDIVAELGGRIVEVKVSEGDEVEAGQVLVELDKSDLLVRRAELETALATAEANLELVSAPPLPEEIDQAEAQLAQAQAGLEGARQTWQRLAEVVGNPRELEAKISQAQARVTAAEENLEMARVNLKRAEIGAEAAGRNQTTRMGGNEGIIGAEAAGYQVQSAQVGVQMAEVALAGAQQQVEHLRQLRQRPLQLIAQANAAEAAYHRAEAAMLAAQANLDAVKAGPTKEDIAVARAKVDAARATLAGLEVQLEKMTLTAPRAGLISRRLIEPGEVAQPGAVLLQLSDIDTVDLVVYVAETRMGEVKLGQKALVYVDAYEGEVFEGVVTFIAHEAEFTPQNVQTREERKNLVFAVKISLDNPEHRLRPGMPADATIVPGEFVELKPGEPARDIRPNIVIDPPSAPSAELAAASTEEPTSKPVEEIGPTTQAEVVSAGLNVRSGPGTGHPVIAGLAKGDRVTVLETDETSGWLKVRLPESDKKGWISGHPTYVSVENGSTEARPKEVEPTVSAATTLVDEVEQAKVVSAGLNVRTGPGIDQPVIGTLVKGDTVSVVETDPETGWLKIALPAETAGQAIETGWISGHPAYVSIK